MKKSLILFLTYALTLIILSCTNENETKNFDVEKLNEHLLKKFSTNQNITLNLAVKNKETGNRGHYNNPNSNINIDNLFDLLYSPTGAIYRDTNNDKYYIKVVYKSYNNHRINLSKYDIEEDNNKKIVRISLLLNRKAPTNRGKPVESQIIIGNTTLSNLRNYVINDYNIIFTLSHEVKNSSGNQELITNFTSLRTDPIDDFPFVPKK